MGIYSPTAPVAAGTRVSLAMYRVGFGDALLLSLEYPQPIEGRAERHVLIDFGRNTAPLLGGGDMNVVAQKIADRCHGKLDVVVVSHRHADHLSGFGLTTAGKIIEGLKPDLVVRPWTEDPAAAANARAPAGAAAGAGGAAGSGGAAGAGGAAGGPRAVSRSNYLAGLAAAESVAEALATGQFPMQRTVAGRSLQKAATAQLSNRAAIDCLDRMAKAGKAEYLHFGDTTTIGEFVPGLEVALLGPPTPQQWPAIATQRENSPEYWTKLHSLLGSAMGFVPAKAAAGAAPAVLAGAPSSPAADAGTSASDEGADGDGITQDLSKITAVGPVHWLIERVRHQQVSSVLRIVRWLDDALNNTSLVLLFKVGDRRLLLPGDAEWENWQYALTQAPNQREIRAELAQVDLYKVGHHGSRNATPKSLYALWHPAGGAAAGPAAGPARAVRSMLSTRDGVYGDTPDTRVPSAALLQALQKQPLHLYSTEETSAAKKRSADVIELSAPSTGPATFEP